MSLINVEIQDNILEVAELKSNEISLEVNRLLILELYREGKVSVGRASELAEMSLYDFMNFMAKHNTYMNYGESDYRDDEETARKLKI